MNMIQNREGLPDAIAEEKRFFPLPSSSKENLPNDWNNPDTWQYLEDIPEDKYFGFAIGKGTDYLFIDADHVRDPENGNLVPWVEEAYKRLIQYGPTYVETSMSGTGFHMICDLGDYADDFPRESNGYEQIIIDMSPEEYSTLPKEEKAKVPKIEFFYHTEGRYIYLTGKHRKKYQVAKNEDAAAIFTELKKLRAEYHEKHGRKELSSDLEGFEVDEDTKRRVLEALPYISANARETWVTVGIALRNCGFPFEVWDTWSRYTDQRAGKLCDKYDQEETPKIWKSFVNTKSHWNAGTIIRMAKENGYLFQGEDHFPPQAKAQEKPEKVNGKYSREDILSAVESMEEVEETEPEWIVHPYIPRGEVVILASKGGTGKGFIVSNILAGITTGKCPSIWGDDRPFQGKQELVLYLTTEDDKSKVLKRRFRQAGVNMELVKIISRRNQIIQDIKLSDENGILKTLISELKPSLVVFDPLQSFLPDRVKMGERNQMRSCINNLSVIGAETSTSFLIFCHMNKRDTTDVQKAIADSNDIWDIARSVMVTGRTETDGVNFLSHEKSNYAPLGNTALYQIVDPGKAVYYGTTKKRFEDFALDNNANKYSAPKKAEAEEFIMNSLREREGHSMLISELDEMCTVNKMSKATVRRAKEALRKDERVALWPVGYGKDRKWYIGFENPMKKKKKQSESDQLNYRQLELP